MQTLDEISEYESASPRIKAAIDLAIAFEEWWEFVDPKDNDDNDPTSADSFKDVEVAYENWVRSR